MHVHGTTTDRHHCTAAQFPSPVCVCRRYITSFLRRRGGWLKFHKQQQQRSAAAGQRPAASGSRPGAPNAGRDRQLAAAINTALQQQSERWGGGSWGSGEGDDDDGNDEGDGQEGMDYYFDDEEEVDEDELMAVAAAAAAAGSRGNRLM